MSRLDSAIRRLTAQRACLDRGVALAADVPGVAVEFGLGNGRTFDHLREKLEPRELFVFDRQVASHPNSTPDADHLILGDLPDSIAAGASGLPAPIAFCHMDIGRGIDEADQALAASIADAVLPFLTKGAVVVSDQPFSRPDLEKMPPPDGVAEDRYHTYKRT